MDFATFIENEFGKTKDFFLTSRPPESEKYLQVINGMYKVATAYIICEKYQKDSENLTKGKQFNKPVRHNISIL